MIAWRVRVCVRLPNFIPLARDFITLGCVILYRLGDIPIVRAGVRARVRVRA
jgi:hypothetical protein